MVGLKASSVEIHCSKSVAHSEVQDVEETLSGFPRHVFAQLLQAKIQKSQKRQPSHKCLFALLESSCLKAVLNLMLIKLNNAYLA
jgi:hypothetical protein